MDIMSWFMNCGITNESGANCIIGWGAEDKLPDVLFHGGGYVGMINRLA